MHVKLKYILPVTTKGRTYHYYRRDGKTYGTIEGKPGSTKFMQNYYRIHGQFEGTSIDIPDSFGAVCTRYLASPEYKALAESTRKQYRIYIDQLRPIFGAYDIKAIRRREIKEYRDAISAQPGKANVSVRVMGAVFAWAIESDIVQINPTAGIKSLPTGEYEAWPETVIAEALETAPPDLARFIAFALYTGQRKSDCIKARWDDIQDGGIRFVQQKTGTEIWVPIHPDLQEVLDNTPKRGVMILTTQTGRPWSISNIDDAMRKQETYGYVLHGLRKNAAIILAEAGCSTEEVKSWTGHKSDQMAAHYVKQARQRELARNALARIISKV